MPSRAEVLATARLARLTFSSDELDRIAFELRGILTHIDELKRVAARATGDAVPNAHAHAHSHAHAHADAEAEAEAEAVAGSDSGGVATGLSVAGAPHTGRADVPGADPLILPPSSIATEWRNGFFTVPRMRTHDAAG